MTRISARKVVTSEARRPFKFERQVGSVVAANRVSAQGEIGPWRERDGGGRQRQTFIAQTQQTVTGKVRLRLYRGNVEVLGRRSPYSLYAGEIASFTMGESYDQKDAAGFINLIGLPFKVRAAIGAKPAQTSSRKSAG